MRSKKVIISSAVAVGIAFGAFTFTPKAIDASNNIIVASVEWVNSQINPMKTKISELESRIATQQNEINQLKAQLGNNPTPPGENTPATYYTNKNATVHSGATRDYRVVANLSPGTQLKVIDSFNSPNGLWYRIEITSSLKGWIFSGDVSTEKPNFNPSTVTLTGEANIRRGATTSYAVIQTLPRGTSLKYISSFVNNAGETWYNVEISTGVRGWVISTLSEVR